MVRECINCGRYGLVDMTCGQCFAEKDEKTGEIIDGPSMWIPKSDGEITPPDMVNHPNHYQLSDGKDCFDIMVEMFGKEAVQTYCVLNAFTYLFRHARKNGKEDVLKAEYNLAKYKELEEKTNVHAE